MKRIILPSIIILFVISCNGIKPPPTPPPPPDPVEPIPVEPIVQEIECFRWEPGDLFECRAPCGCKWLFPEANALLNTTVRCKHGHEWVLDP